MADQTPIDAIADIVRGNGRIRDIDKAYAELPYTVGADRPLRPAPTSQRIGFASVRQALDEVEKRLQSVVLASEEVMRFHTRPEPMKEALQGQLPGDRPDGTVWEDLATRAVLLSRAIESLERNLKITLETLR